jgi:hypothetical protein
LFILLLIANFQKGSGVTSENGESALNSCLHRRLIVCSYPTPTLYAKGQWIELFQLSSGYPFKRICMQFPQVILLPLVVWPPPAFKSLLGEL